MVSEPDTFTSESLAFLANLKTNNTKEWFSANKTAYETAIKNPAAVFKGRLQKDLSELTGKTLTSKVFRINRDLRFSKDKTPYNTHIRMAFWSDSVTFEAKQAQPPSFFLSIEVDQVRFGMGSMQFPKPVLERYLSQLENGLGAELTTLLSALNVHEFKTSEPDLSKPPKTVSKDALYSELAKHKGLAVWKTLKNTNLIVGDQASSLLRDHFAPTLPLWNALSRI